MGRRTILLVAAVVVAALGTVLVFLYAHNADSRAEANNDPVNVLVAKSLVNTGTTGAAAQASGAFEVKSLPRSAVAPGALASATPVAEQLSLSPIYAGQQVLAQQFGDSAAASSNTSSLLIPKGKLAVSVQLGDPARVAGFVEPGSKVAVFVTMQDINNPDVKAVRVLIPSVQVIAAGPTTLVSASTSGDAGTQNTEELPKALLTLAVDQKDAEKLILGQDKGALYFGLLGDSSNVTAGGGTVETGLFPLMTAIIDIDPAVAETLHAALGAESVVLPTMDALERHLKTHLGEDTVVVGPTVDLQSALDLATEMRVIRPSLGVVLVRRRVDASVLGDALRAGIRDIVEERDLAGVNDAVKRSHEIATQLREQVPGVGSHDEDRTSGTLVTVFSAKGGCGKTTLSTNLAAVLADGGRHSVCLVDLDLAFGDVAIALQLFPSHTIADALPVADTLDLAALEALLTPHSPGLTALVAPLEPGTAAQIPASMVARILAILKDNYDYVVVDSPPAFDDQVLAAFDASDVIALIATLDIPALKNLKLTIETLELLNYPREKWHVVLNRSDSKVGLAMAEVEKTLKVPVTAQIPSSRDVPASINRGVPIVLDDPKHPVTLAIKEFAAAYVTNTGSVSATDTAIPTELRSDRRSLLRRKAKS